MDGAKTKNLFLRDSKGKRHFLIVMSADRAVELKSLFEAIGRTKLGFASQEDLWIKKRLGNTDWPSVRMPLGLRPSSVLWKPLVCVNIRWLALTIIFITRCLPHHPIVTAVSNLLYLSTSENERFRHPSRHPLGVDYVTEGRILVLYLFVDIIWIILTSSQEIFLGDFL